jgi:hypothetical protein
VSQLVRLSNIESVSGVISTAGGDDAVRVAQLADRTAIVVVDVAGMRDALASGSRVNWTFSCLPAEVAVIEAVTLRLTGEAGDDFALLHTNDDASWALAVKLRSWFSRIGIRPRLQTEVSAAAPELPATVKAVLVLAPPQEFAAIVHSLPRTVRIFSGPDAARRKFIVAAGDRANAVRVPVLAATASGLPDYAAAQTMTRSY